MLLLEAAPRNHRGDACNTQHGGHKNVLTPSDNDGGCPLEHCSLPNIHEFGNAWPCAQFKALQMRTILKNLFAEAIAANDAIVGCRHT